MHSLIIFIWFSHDSETCETEVEKLSRPRVRVICPGHGYFHLCSLTQTLAFTIFAIVVVMQSFDVIFLTEISYCV